jgi:hypothetical protein
MQKGKKTPQPPLEKKVPKEFLILSLSLSLSLSVRRRKKFGKISHPLSVGSQINSPIFY